MVNSSFLIDQEFTLVHWAVKNGWLLLVNDVFIDKLRFDANFYKVGNRLTLLHVVAKYRTHVWSDQDKDEVKKLILKSDNLLLKNNMQSTII